LLIHRYLEASLSVSEAPNRAVGGFNVFVRASAICREFKNENTCRFGVLASQFVGLKLNL
jgi:hypothetical protein